MPRPTHEVLIRGALLPEGDDLSQPCDITILDGRIAAVTPSTGQPPSGNAINANGRICMPGFVDAHCHAASAVFEPTVQEAMLRQGITTIIVGQDGIGAAPSDNTSYQWSSNYFAGLDGQSPNLHPGALSRWLDAYDGTVPINVAALVPHGSLRYLVSGAAQRPSTPAELTKMSGLLDAALEQGAIGLSTGLEYVPAAWADSAELVALLQVVAARHRVHASHMRGYEAAAPGGVAELIELATITGATTHIAHYHGDADLLGGLLDEATAASAPMTFDSYAYTKGCSLLTMVALPRWLPLADADATLAQLADADIQPRVMSHMAELTDLWPRITMAWADGTDDTSRTPLDRVAGLSLPDIAMDWGIPPEQAVLRLLLGTQLLATCVFQQPPSNTDQAISRLADRVEHMAGSDAVYVPFNEAATGHPHPRGWGAMTRWLVDKVTPGAWSWAQAVDHLSHRAIARFGLGDRGSLRAGAIADLVLIDPAQLCDRATYVQPRTLATGVDDVLVAGVPVLVDGQLTGMTPGRGLRWESR